MNTINNYYDINNDEVRFAEPSEISEEVSHIVFKNEMTNASGMIIRSNGREADVDNNDVRTLIVADSGAGKTRRCVIPMVISMIMNGVSMVLHDPKGEIYKWSAELLEQFGYSARILNFRSPMTGNQYNPLNIGAKLYAQGEKSKATEYFFSFAYNLYEPHKSEKDPFWTNESENYLTGLCLLACELLPVEQITIDNIYHIHLMGQEKMGCSTVIKEYFTSEKKTSEAWRLLEATIMAPNETRASIISVMTQVLSRLVVNEDIVDMLGKSDFEIEKIGTEKTAVFLITKDETSVYNTIVSSFVEQAYMALIDMAECNYNGSLPVRVEFVMDEFGNMAKLNDINEKITASRSRNIRWHLVVQGLEQLSIKYGKEVSSILLGNCDTWCYLHSNDLELLTYISKRCGEYKAEYTNEKRQLLSVSRLQHFNKKEGECLILMGRQHPYITYLPDISEYEYKPFGKLQFKKRTKGMRNLFDLKEYVENIGKEKSKKCLDTFFSKTDFEELMTATLNDVTAPQ